MPPSAKEIRDLEKFAPKTLREPSAEPLVSGAKAALLRWSAASGFGPALTKSWPLGNPRDDQTFGFAMVGDVCGMALWLHTTTEMEQERTRKIAAAEREVRPRTLGDPPLVFRSGLRSPEDFHPLLREESSKVQRDAKRIFDELRELQVRQRLLESQLEDRLAAFVASRENLVVPIVASGYLNDPRRGEEVAEETCFLFYLTGWGIPLLRAIAMIGELRNERIAVDLDHERLDTIYERHAKSLQRLKVKVREVSDRSAP